MKRLGAFLAWLIPLLVSLAALSTQVNAKKALTNARSWFQPFAWVPEWLYDLLTSPVTLSLASAVVGYLLGKTVTSKSRTEIGPLPSPSELVRLDTEMEAVANQSKLVIGGPARQPMSEAVSIQSVSQHDKVLFAAIDKQFGDGLLGHFREHDFANDVHKSKVQALWDIGCWEGARYQFVDTTVQASWAELFALIQRFNELQSDSLVARQNSADFFTVHHLGRPKHPMPESVRREISALNELACALERQFNSFAALARRRLGL